MDQELPLFVKLDASTTAGAPSFTNYVRLDQICRIEPTLDDSGEIEMLSGKTLAVNSGMKRLLKHFLLGPS